MKATKKQKKSMRIYYLMNKKRLNKQNKKNYLKNRRQLIEYKKNYYQIHRQKFLKLMKEYYQTHKEQAKQYHELHRNKILKGQKEYYQKNKKQINKNDTKQRKLRYHTDVNFKLICNLRSRVNRFIKYPFKSKSTIKLLSCSIDFLKRHLESKFKLGMSWANYGKWHIDHIRPCASFDLGKPIEQRRYFHYTNLQPLWKIDNLKKGIKYSVKFKRGK